MVQQIQSQQLMEEFLEIACQIFEGSFAENIGKNSAFFAELLGAI
jgi:hypothetical protein